MGILIVAFIFLVIPALLVLTNFLFYLFQGRLLTNLKLWKIIEIITSVIFPLLFIMLFDINAENECCTDSAVFSPKHRIGIYFLIVSYITAYVISIFRKQLFPPIPELLLNTFLILGLIINVLIIFHVRAIELGEIIVLIGNIPIILLLLLRLYENQKLLGNYIKNNDIQPNGFISRLCYYILTSKPLYKFPALLIILVPILIILSLILMLFGQKPDTLIRAFTDTYRHGFSQLNHMCDNVNCGGHFLCSVGAKGHKSIVKPVRYGERNGQKIICNRQLLISNAFEELVQEKMPIAHNYIRRNYNKVGSFIHKYYHVFNIRFVSDIVYIIMKPFEWFFLLTIYTFDKKPENRIAKQYLSSQDKKQIEKQIISKDNGLFISKSSAGYN